MLENFLQKISKEAETPKNNIENEGVESFNFSPWKLSLTPKESFHSKEKIYGETLEKDITVFIDELNKSWYKLEKKPQIQMFTALVASTFSNISPIIKKEMYTEIGEKIEKIDKIIPFLKLSDKYKNKDWYKQDVYFSKTITLNTEPKDFTNAVVEDNILNVVFDDNDHDLGINPGFPKRNFVETLEQDGDNTNYYYGFFDFDNASILKNKDSYKKSKEIEIGANLNQFNKNFPEKFNDYVLVSQQKIKDFKEFIFSKEGEDFIKAAYKKANLDKFYEILEKKKMEEKEYFQKGSSKKDYIELENMYNNTISEIRIDGPDEVYSILKERILILEEINEKITEEILTKTRIQQF